MIEAIKFQIGETYRHPRGKKKFKLKEVTLCAFHFECGHWCTDCVFQNFINDKTGKPVFQEQLELFQA